MKFKSVRTKMVFGFSFMGLMIVLLGTYNFFTFKSTNVSTSLQAGYKDVEAGTAQIVTSGETFNKINVAVTDMVDQIQSVSVNLSDISTHSRNMSTAIEEIAAVSEESAAGIEETSASSEQASSAMDEVSAKFGELMKLAEEMNQLISRFTL